MKKFAIVFIALLPPVYVFSQYQDPDMDQVESKQVINTYPLYLGLGSGVNHYSGIIGLTTEGNISGNFSAVGDLGIGDLGYKFSAGLRYYQHYPKGLFYGVGISYTPGIDSTRVKLETTQSTGKTTDVDLKINKIETLNLSLGYAWTLGKRFRFNLELGYAILLPDTPYEVLTPGVKLTSTSKQAMNLITPGGLLLGFGFSFGM